MELKEKEKIEKYQDLARELRKLWKVKTRVVPIVIRALGTIPNGLVGHLESIGVNLDVAQESSDGFSTTKFAGCDL